MMTRGTARAGSLGYGGYGDESSDDDDDDDEARGASSGVGEGDSAPIGSKRGGKREGAGRKHGSVSQPKPNRETKTRETSQILGCWYRGSD